MLEIAVKNLFKLHRIVLEEETVSRKTLVIDTLFL